VIFGAGDNTNSLTEAFRWTSSTGYTLLGFLPGTENSSSNAASSNGSVIVGNSGGEPFRWTAASGMVNLGVLSGYGSAEANGVSGDGSLVVGSAQAGSSEAAFIWTSSTGTMPLQEYLSQTGLGSELAGWQLEDANVSSNGESFCGVGIDPSGNSEAWVATIPEPSTIALLLAGAIIVGGRLVWIRRLEP
jgi:uncharacterized membrane protein